MPTSERGQGKCRSVREYVAGPTKRLQLRSRFFVGENSKKDVHSRHSLGEYAEPESQQLEKGIHD
ncbi:hypothetical protein GCM10008968_44170 [Bacillus horti]